jgi:hypothetical protein
MVGASALSCLTANLSTYLASAIDDPLGHIARSIRLGVRFGDTVGSGDTPAFSHHRYPIAVLGPGRRLAYQGADDPASAVGRLGEQIEQHHAVLVLAYSGALPWSLAAPTDTAPHLVLLTGYDNHSWLATDAFSALLPGGRQEPFAGPIGTADLLRAMRTPALSVEQRHRVRYAFGTTDVPPDREYRWLQPTADERDNPDPYWADDPAVVLPRLANLFTALPEAAELTDDMWAAAQHHTFRYSHLLHHHPLTGDDTTAVSEAMTAWTGLPMSLHFAADSARRGRPRPSLVVTAFQALLDAEARCASILNRLGYTAPRGRRTEKGEP